VLLLGYFRETKAHARIAEILSLPNDTAYELFGDGITEDFAAMLVRTYPGSPTDLFRLIHNDDADTYCRSAGFRALSVLVAEGRIERDTVLRELLAILDRGLACEDADAVSRCVDAAYELHPAGLMPQIRMAYELGLANTFMIHPSEIEEVLESDLAAHQEKQVRRFQERHSEDFHSWISWWATYKGSPSAKESAARAGGPSTGGKSTSRKKASPKRKAARKARRRNRRKRRKK